MKKRIVDWRIVGATWTSISPYHGEILFSKGIVIHVSADEDGQVLVSRNRCHERMKEVVKQFNLNLK